MSKIKRGFKKKKKKKSGSSESSQIRFQPKTQNNPKSKTWTPTHPKLFGLGQEGWSGRMGVCSPPLDIEWTRPWIQIHYLKKGILILNRWKSHFRPYIYTQFPLWSLSFIFTSFTPYPEKCVSFLSLPLYQRRKMHTWQTVELKYIKNILFYFKIK